MCAFVCKFVCKSYISAIVMECLNADVCVCACVGGGDAGGSGGQGGSSASASATSFSLRRSIPTRWYLLNLIEFYAHCYFIFSYTVALRCIVFMRYDILHYLPLH